MYRLETPDLTVLDTELLEGLARYCRKFQKIRAGSPRDCTRNKLVLYRLTYRIQCAGHFHAMLGELPPEGLNHITQDFVKRRLSILIVATIR